ncbi:MAG: HDOD domain-containing protein [Deltaproteobacteria bacterium]|nr:HDOD domain-containing protein [Deltaproteobacteria bacterium]
MTLTRKDILLKLARVENLPSPPRLLNNALSLIENPDSSVEEIAKIISQDAAISAKLISISNSPFFRGATEVTELQTACVRLGLNELQNLLLASVLSGTFSVSSEETMNKFWLHSMACGYTTDVIFDMSVSSKNSPFKSMAFSSGLLHDLGSLVLMQQWPEEYNLLIETLIQGDTTIFNLETEKWGVNHSEIGDLLSRRWKLPEVYRFIMRYHHEPWEAPEAYSELVKAVHLADFICSSQGFARVESMPIEFDSTSWDYFGLSEDDVPEILDRVERTGEKSEHFSSLIK